MISRYSSGCSIAQSVGCSTTVSCSTGASSPSGNNCVRPLNRGDRLAAAIDDRGVDPARRTANHVWFSISVVIARDARSGCDGGSNVGAPVRDMQRVRLGQPDVAIDARAFIEPAFAQRRIDAQQQHVPPAVVYEVGDIEAKRRVAAHVAAHEVAVENDDRVAKDAVELDRDAAAKVARRHIENTAVPSDARFGIRAS